MIISSEEVGRSGLLDELEITVDVTQIAQNTQQDITEITEDLEEKLKGLPILRDDDPARAALPVLSLPEDDLLEQAYREAFIEVVKLPPSAALWKSLRN